MNEVTTTKPVLKWFTYNQNNSGGYFIIDESVCETVVIQAISAREANRVAEDLFAGRSDFCECCGERWYSLWEDEEGDDVPSVYGEPLEGSKARMFRENYVLHYANGIVEFVKLPASEGDSNE